MSRERRQVLLGFSIWPTGRHASAWRLPEAYIHGTTEREFLERTIRTCERGKFDYYFVGSVIHSNPWLQNSRHNDLFKIEPFTLAGFAAAITKNIGLVVTINSTYSDPYNVARASASLDHLSGGRAALNIITGAAGSFAAENFSRERHLGTDERYDRATELIDAIKDLWDSWEDDWLIGDRAGGRFLDVDKAHEVNFQGEYFSIKGPLNVPRPPQGHLPLLHAGTSERSNEYGAKYADIRFISYTEKEDNKKYYRNIKERLGKYGRRQDDQFLVPGITFYTAETSREAHAKFREVQDLSINQFVPQQLSAQLGIDLGKALPTERVRDVIDLENIPRGAWLVRSAIAGFGDDDITLRDLFHFLGNVPFGQPPVVGSGKDIANWIEEQFEERALDGVKLFPPYLPGALDAFVEYAVPHLQHKGIFRKEYSTSTFRGHLGLPNAANELVARAGRPRPSLKPKVEAASSPASPGPGHAGPPKEAPANGGRASAKFFISADELERLRDSGKKVVVLHVGAGDEAQARRDYDEGHIPGAHFAAIAADLSGPRGELTGDRPLPAPEKLQERVIRWGIDPDSTVVVYDRNKGLSAGRAWWVLRWAGVSDVRLLDGGLDWWSAGGRLPVAQEPASGQGTHVVQPGALPVLDADGAQRLAREGVLLDARGEKQYSGSGQYYTVNGVRQFIGTPGEAPLGHIPGAINVPTQQNLRPDGLLRSDDELRERFSKLGVTEAARVGVYCGAGVSAAHLAAVLASLGIEASLFVGSWSAWTSEPSRPVATGPEPG